LRAGLDADAAVIDQRGLPVLGLSNAWGQQQEQSSDRCGEGRRRCDLSDE
jgi:hypothetical protein